MVMSAQSSSFSDLVFSYKLTNNSNLP